jgi:flagellar hook-associated protein 1 FlgK
MNTGRSGLVAAKASIATTGHNIANTNTEGYSRQRVLQGTDQPHPAVGNHGFIGTGVLINRVERLNDEYVEKQIRNGNRELAHMEEKDLALRQTEDIFNESNGDGINRLMARFFNEFRKLSNEPDNEAIRQAVREGAQSLVNDFHRIRKEVDDVRSHIDSRVEGFVKEVNSLAETIRDLNSRIQVIEVSGASANDLLDKRDLAVKQLAANVEVNVYKDRQGNVNIDLANVGPLVTGPNCEKILVRRTEADGQGKPENALTLSTSANANGDITHVLKGGKIGALLQTRDQTLSTVLDRLDELAFNLTSSVNEIHTQGFSREGLQGIHFFKPSEGKFRASEFISLSDHVKESAGNIAAAAIPDAPGDNRIAIAISGLQGARIMNGGKSTADDFYNSIISDVGVATNKNRSGMNQQKDIVTQLGKMREQISGVSLDEEAANLLQFQHAFDASAKVIQVADEMLKTVLDLKRY